MAQDISKLLTAKQLATYENPKLTVPKNYTRYGALVFLALHLLNKSMKSAKLSHDGAIVTSKGKFHPYTITPPVFKASLRRFCWETFSQDLWEDVMVKKNLSAQELWKNCRLMYLRTLKEGAMNLRLSITPQILSLLMANKSQ